MKKSTNGSFNVYLLNLFEWQQFTQFNPFPESLGIKINLMNDNSRKIIIDSAESFKVMRFEAAVSAAQIKTEKWD
jgi:hypothetical protein